MIDTVVINRTSTQGRIAILHVQGRLDAKTSHFLRERGAEVAAEGKDLIINLNGVTFMGSSGLGALLALSEEFGEQAGRVRITEPSDAVRSVLSLLSLDQVLAIDSTENESLKAMTTP
jgi:anti-sigma B factor antagonist